MELINVSVLGWTTDPLLLTHRRKYAYGRKYHLPILTGYIFPFQLSRPHQINGISNVTLVQDETGTEVDITAEMVNSGLSIVTTEGASTDMIRYLGTVPIAGTWSEGLYYLKMTDSTTQWYSDFFCFTDVVDDFVKLEWWHNSPIEYRDGIIDYSFPYRNYVYLHTDIGKPTYPVDELIDTREGREFAIRTTTWKEYQFNAVVPEYLTDVFRLIRQHDNQRVIVGDTTYVCDLLKMDPEIEWIGTGLFGAASFVFRTGTFVSTRSKPGQGQTNANPNACVATRYTVNQIVTGSEFFANFSDVTSFGNPGEFFAVNSVFDIGAGPQGSLSVYRIKADGTAQLETAIEDDLFFDVETLTYYVHRGDSIAFNIPEITSVVRDADPATTATITAYTITGATVELMYRTPLNTFVSAGTFTSAQLKAGLNIDVDGWEAVKLRFITTSCGFIQETEVFFIDLPAANPLTGLNYTTALNSYQLA